MPVMETLAIIGAGPVGRGIAQAAAMGGYHTILEDIVPAALRRAQQSIQESLQQEIALGRRQPSEAAAALSRLEYAGNIDQAARAADLVVECVPDELESKLEIFTLLDRTCRPHTMLASNIGSLHLGEIASITYRPHKIFGVRFSHPVAWMRRLEVVQTEATDEETMAAALDFGRRLRLEVAVIREAPALSG